MNRDKALEAFKEYSDLYDTSDFKIKLKIDHTYRVADIAARIAESVENADPDFSWVLGLLHDIGRFEQLTQYGTFKDADSVDHAELGADILFNDGLIENFPDISIAEAGADVSGRKSIDGWKGIAETAIRLHNKLALPDGLDKTTELYCNILRDADKCDIFRVLTEPPYDERNEMIVSRSAGRSVEAAKEDVMKCIHEHRCVPNIGACHF